MIPAERLLIEHECARLQTLYTLYADRLDVEAFTQLFTPDGSIRVPEAPAFVGHDAIRASMRALAATGVTSRHLCTNSLIDVRDAASADGVCYLVVFNSAEPPDAMGFRPVDRPGTVGEYHDRFRRTPAGWRFESRELHRVFRRMDDPVRLAAQSQ